MAHWDLLPHAHRVRSGTVGTEGKKSSQCLGSLFPLYINIGAKKYNKKEWKDSKLWVYFLKHC